MEKVEVLVLCVLLWTLFGPWCVAVFDRVTAFINGFGKRHWMLILVGYAALLALAAFGTDWGSDSGGPNVGLVLYLWSVYCILGTIFVIIASTPSPRQEFFSVSKGWREIVRVIGIGPSYLLWKLSYWVKHAFQAQPVLVRVLGLLRRGTTAMAWVLKEIVAPLVEVVAEGLAAIAIPVVGCLISLVGLIFAVAFIKFIWNAV